MDNATALKFMAYESARLREETTFRIAGISDRQIRVLDADGSWHKAGTGSEVERAWPVFSIGMPEYSTSMTWESAKELIAAKFECEVALFLRKHPASAFRGGGCE